MEPFPLMPKCVNNVTFDDDLVRLIIGNSWKFN